MGSAAVLERKRTAAPPPSRGWWGHGPSPTARWPGRTIEIPAVWVSGRQRWESPDGVYYYDDAEAERAVAFFPTYLRHHIGVEFAGKAFTLLDYQQLLLTRPLFGWKRAVDGLRRFRKLFAFLPKGAGKSPWGAGTGLYLAFCDREPGAEVYAVAADKKQARVVHDNARVMVEMMQEVEPELNDLFVVFRDAIECRETHSKYEVISADASTKHGFRPHAVIFDELHAQKNRLLYEALKKSMVKRLQPLMVILTHAGYDQEGIGYEEYEYAKGVLHGTRVDETCLPVVFEMGPEEDWRDPAVWRRLNPGYGITVKHDGLVTECTEAQNEPRKLNDFLMFYGNRWVNQAVAWLPVDWWDGCEPDPIDDYGAWLAAHRAEFAALPCAAGLDLAQKWDLTSLVIACRYRMTDVLPAVQVVATDQEQPITKTVDLNYGVVLLPFFWIPEDTMQQHERQDGVPYADWVRRGLVIPTEGPVIDYSRIYRDITEKILPQFPKLKQGTIGYDPAFATDLATNLRDRGGLKVEEVLQNYPSLSESAQIFGALVKAHRVRHGRHRVLRNHVSNASVKTDDAGRIRLVRPKTQQARSHIDGVVASVMAVKMVQFVPDVAIRPRAFVI